MTRKFLILIIFYNFVQIDGQQSSNGCAQYLRNIHKMGPNISGRLEIPVDEHFPRYKLKIGFSTPIHHMSIRQTRAKDTGTHRDFIIDPMELHRDGKMKLDVFIRLNNIFAHTPRMTRIVYNNVALCGDPVSASEIDEAFGSGFPSTSPPRRTTVPVLTPFNNTLKTKDKDYGEDEDDIF